VIVVSLTDQGCPTDPAFHQKDLAVELAPYRLSTMIETGI
jgi:hypothetical protein